VTQAWNPPIRPSQDNRVGAYRFQAKTKILTEG
jgi:hypothetical protein